jgi:hypothetical protein
MKPTSPTTSYQIKGNLANQGDPATTSKHQYVLRFVVSGEHAVICQKKCSLMQHALAVP